MSDMRFSEYGYDPGVFDGHVDLAQYLDEERRLFELPGQLSIEDEYEAIDHDRMERTRRQRERVIDWLAED